MKPPSVVIVMGAAVWEGGQPSNAMRRRIEGALASSDGTEDIFLVSGGVGKFPPSEAEVMATLLREAGIPASRIVRDDAARDTLESVRNCVGILHSIATHDGVIVCSDVYHIPRCRLLLWLYGVPTRAGKVASGRSQNPTTRWIYYYLREMAAVPWDAFLVLLSRLRK